MNTSDLFVQSMIQNNVKTIYGVPGEENIDLIEAIRKSGQINLILTRNEQTAVFMASTYGRLTGEVGVAIATLGPGATNMLTGVAYAQLGGFPVMVITGQKPIKKSKQGFFQIIDVVAMMRPVTKYSTSIVSGNKVPYTLANAFRIAKSERPGAVHIELPEDVASEEIESNLKFDISTAKVRRPVIDDKAIESLRKELEKAKSPIVLIGAGANRKRITKYLTEFIVKYNIPFFTSQMGKGVVDESIPQYLGTSALTSGDYIHEAIAMSDLILSVGYDPIEKPTHLIGANGTKTIHINFYEADIDAVYDPNLQIVGDIANVFRQLYKLELNTKLRDFKKIYDTKNEYSDQMQKNLKYEILDAKNIIGPRQLVDTVRSIFGPSDIVVLDNGLYKVRFARNYPCYQPNTLLLDNALATMGAGLASGMEAKRLNPDRNVVVIVGDGGLLMNMGDLETIIRMQIDLTVVVLNNGSYGMIKRKQQKTNIVERGLDFGNPDFVKLVESFGGKGYKVENKADFEDILIQANQTKGLKIIDLKFEYDPNIN